MVTAFVTVGARHAGLMVNRGRSNGRLARGLLFVLSLLAPLPASAQVRWQDFVVTMGGSVERYSGNFSAVTVPVVDSTQRAHAAIAEVGLGGALQLLARERQAVVLFVDAGVRQASATGFRLRDYAPREWAGNTSLRAEQALGSSGRLIVRAGLRGRSVDDRPPMPLFLQPGFTTLSGSIGVETGPQDGVVFDLEVDGESADYRALEFLPQLDLLDRRATGVEAGARWGNTLSMIRFFGGLRWSEYQHQGSFDAADPFRRDRTIRAGLEWTHRGGELFAQVGVEGTLNRSNSNRPEYDALNISGIASMPLPGDLTLIGFALLTGKSYVHETDFARLVPGEEADNASIAYLEVARGIGVNLDTSVRLGWTRAETDIGNAYYQRFGMSFRLNYRPGR